VKFYHFLLPNSQKNNAALMNAEKVHTCIQTFDLPRLSAPANYGCYATGSSPVSFRLPNADFMQAL